MLGFFVWGVKNFSLLIDKRVIYCMNMDEQTSNQAEITNTDLLVAMEAFSERMDKQMANMQNDIAYLKATSVTKEYLDDKLSTMYGNSMSVDKKVDKHVDAVVEVLSENKVISENQKQKLMSLEPFPKLTV